MVLLVYHPALTLGSHTFSLIQNQTVHTDKVATSCKLFINFHKKFHPQEYVMHYANIGQASEIANHKSTIKCASISIYIRLFVQM